MTVLAPAGWGFVPGFPLLLGDSDAAAALPELPLLALVPARERNAVITDAIAAIPGLPGRLRPRDVRDRYSIPKASACDVLTKAKRLQGLPPQ